MRLNIPKLAEGGAPLPLVDYMPFTGVGGAGQTASGVEVEDKSKSGSSSSKDDIGIKDILNLTSQLNALPNESRDIARAISELQFLGNLSDRTAGGPESSFYRTRLINLYSSILSKVKVANFNKAMYDKTYEHLLSNGGLNEIAITQDGKLFVQDVETGKSAKMSVEDFNKLRKDNPGKYEALTNDNLLNERSESAGFSFRNEIMGTINNGIGDEEVTKRLLQVLNGLGKDNLQKEGYSEKSADNIQRGMGVLQQAYEEGMTVDGLYKQGYISEIQRAQTDAALNYLWKNLDPNIKTFLKYKSGDEDAEAGGKKLMADLAFSRNSSKEAFSLDLVKNPGKSSDDAIKGGTELDPVKALILGMGYQKEFVLNTGSSYQSRLLGNYSVLTNHSGEPLGEYSTLRDVSSGAFAPSLDFNNATIGGARIDTLDRAFLNNADIIGVDLPIDQKYYAETGIIRPDIMLMEKVEQLHTAMKQGIIDKGDPEKVNAFCDQIGLPRMYSSIDDNGIPQLDTSNFARFARLTGMVDESALADGQEVDKTVATVGDNKRNNFKTYMKKENKDYDLSEGLFGVGKDELYEGAIYIPIRQDIIAASLGGTKYFKVGTQDAITVAQKWADNQAIQNYQKAPSLAEIKS